MKLRKTKIDTLIAWWACALLSQHSFLLSPVSADEEAERSKLFKMTYDLPKEINRRIGLEVSTVNMPKFNQILSAGGQQGQNNEVVQVFVLYTIGINKIPTVERQTPEGLYERLRPMLEAKAAKYVPQQFNTTAYWNEEVGRELGIFDHLKSATHKKASGRFKRATRKTTLAYSAFSKSPGTDTSRIGTNESLPADPHNSSATSATKRPIHTKDAASNTRTASNEETDVTDPSNEKQPNTETRNTTTREADETIVKEHRYMETNVSNAGNDRAFALQNSQNPLHGGIPIGEDERLIDWNQQHLSSSSDTNKQLSEEDILEAISKGEDIMNPYHQARRFSDPFRPYDVASAYSSTTAIKEQEKASKLPKSTVGMNIESKGSKSATHSARKPPSGYKGSSSHHNSSTLKKKMSSAVEMIKTIASKGSDKKSKNAHTLEHEPEMRPRVNTAPSCSRNPRKTREYPNKLNKDIWIRQAISRKAPTKPPYNAAADAKSTISLEKVALSHLPPKDETSRGNTVVASEPQKSSRTRTVSEGAIYIESEIRDDVSQHGMDSLSIGDPSEDDNFSVCSDLVFMDDKSDISKTEIGPTGSVPQEHLSYGSKKKKAAAGSLKWQPGLMQKGIMVSNEENSYSNGNNIYNPEDRAALTKLIEARGILKPINEYTRKRYRNWEMALKDILRYICGVEHFRDDGYLYDIDDGLVADIVDWNDPGPYGVYFPQETILQTSESFETVEFEYDGLVTLKVVHKKFGGWFEPHIMIILKSKNQLHREIGWSLSNKSPICYPGCKKDVTEEVRRYVSSPMDLEDHYLDITVTGPLKRFPLQYYMYRKTGDTIEEGVTSISFAKVYRAFEFYTNLMRIEYGEHDINNETIERIANVLAPAVPVSSKAKIDTLPESNKDDALVVLHNAYANILDDVDSIFSGDGILRVANFVKKRKNTFAFIITFVCLNILVTLLSLVAISVMLTKSLTAPSGGHHVSAYHILWDIVTLARWRRH